MESGLVTLVQLIWDQLGGKWLALAVVVSAVLHYTGILKYWFGARVSERAQLSKDQQIYIDDLQKEVDLQRHRRAEDAEGYAREIARLTVTLAEARQQNQQLIETNANLAKGESRLRHALRGTCQYIAILCFAFKRIGQRPPPFEGWKQLLDFDSDLAEQMKDLL